LGSAAPGGRLEAPQATPAGQGGGNVATGGDEDPWSSAYTMAHDLLGGVSHGASLGTTDDALDAVGMGEALRQKWSDAEARSPVAYKIGDVGGAIFSPITKVLGAAGLVSKAPGALGAMANGAIEGGVSGAIQGVGDAEEGSTMDELAKEAGWSGALGAAGGGL